MSSFPSGTIRKEMHDGYNSPFVVAVAVETTHIKMAKWTCTGILAHESALEGDVIKYLPKETISV